MMRSFIDITNRLFEHVNYDQSAIIEYVNTNLDWSSGDGEQIYEEFRHFHKLDEEDEIDPKEFQSWFSNWVENAYSETEWTIEYCLSEEIGRAHV